jgi:hypothetical protein
MHPEKQDRKRNDRNKHISRPSLKSAFASAVFISGHRQSIIRRSYRPRRFCHNIMASVYMHLPCSLLPTPPCASASSRKRPVRLTSAHSYAPDPLFARLLTWTPCSRAGVGRTAPVSLLVVLTVLHVGILLAWLNRVLPFDSYRYAFNAETLKALPRRGRTLALMFSSPSGVGLLPQSKCGSPSNKNIRAPCEAVALGTLAGKCEPHTRRISEKEH